MENQDRLSAWLADLYRAGYEGWARFMCTFHGGEPAAKAAEIADLEHAYQMSPDTTEQAP